MASRYLGSPAVRSAGAALTGRGVVTRPVRRGVPR